LLFNGSGGAFYACTLFVFFGSKMDPAESHFGIRKSLVFEYSFEYFSASARASILMTFGSHLGCFFYDLLKLKTALAKGNRN